MDERLMKRVADSRTIQHYLVMDGDTNGRGVLFGGKLLSWIDMLAGIVSLRHCDSVVLTRAIDNLEFKRSARVTDVVTMDGRVTWVGNSSLEVRIDTYRENRGATRELINTAFVVMVCMEDDCVKPKTAPGLIPESDEEKQEWAAAVRRNELRKQRRLEGN